MPTLMYAVVAAAVGATVGFFFARANAEAERQRAQSLALQLAESQSKLAEKSVEAERARADAMKATVERDAAERNVQDREARLERFTSDLHQAQREILTLTADLKGARIAVAEQQRAHEQIVEAKSEQISKLNDFIAQARQALTTEFKAVSADTLKDVSAQLVSAANSLIEQHGQQAASEVATHKEEIKTILKPVEESMKRLDKHVEDSNLARTRAEALLNEQVQRLAGASESLTNALRKPVVRGSWGEMTLENALETAGLEAGIDFVLQHTTDDGDKAQRTDAVVNLPKGRKLIIDSKNLMQTYLAVASATEPTERELRADAHSKALRAHIKALSAKEYWRRYDGLDCVILFIPHDGMYHAAIQDESELIREASEKRVFVANPMTLIPLLKAVRYVLDQERLNESAEAISKVGSELYADITRFAEKMTIVGDKLERTVEAFNDSLPALDRFIISKSRKLKHLGAAHGADAEAPTEIDIRRRSFASVELKALAASAADESSSS